MSSEIRRFAEANTDRINWDLKLPPWVNLGAIGADSQRLERLCDLAGIGKLVITNGNKTNLAFGELEFAEGTEDDLLPSGELTPTRDATMKVSSIGELIRERAENALFRQKPVSDPNIQASALNGVILQTLMQESRVRVFGPSMPGVTTTLAGVFTGAAAQQLLQSAQPEITVAASLLAVNLLAQLPGIVKSGRGLWPAHALGFQLDRLVSLELSGINACVVGVLPTERARGLWGATGRDERVDQFTDG
ncbi:hypothetical protein CO046_04350 [Candidatus Peregrinibacteria bacterium CG_4_9_14_0_2_um_filter_53_11]|nr:MAG: hypothetical protein CO046_04350 [Candidatus Peregrinibacteria bacterium CG_4_9_14_0_2_um_filter_53_11]